PVPLGALLAEWNPLIVAERKQEYGAWRHQRVARHGRLDLVHADVVVGRIFGRRLIVHLHIAGAEHERHGNPREPDEPEHAAPFVAGRRRSPGGSRYCQGVRARPYRPASSGSATRIPLLLSPGSGALRRSEGDARAHRLLLHRSSRAPELPGDLSGWGSRLRECLQSFQFTGAPGCAIVRWTSCHRSYSTITQQRAGLIMIHGSAADHNMLEMSRPAHCQGLDVASAQ